MPSEGDTALAALSHWGRTNLPRFREALDINRAATPGRGTRAAAVRLFDSLGHAVVAYGTSAIEVAPPALARLPVRGLPQAALCGFRTPAFVARLREIAREQGKKCILRAQPQPRPDAPARITVEAESVADLERFAGAGRLLVPRQPPALALIAFAPSISDVEDGLAWRPSGDLSWTRWDFDPDRLAFSTRPRDDALVLSSFLDPVRYTRLHYVQRGSEGAIVDRSWGRFLVLKAKDQHVIHYDSAEHRLSVPVGCPLPATLSRAVTLCSGQAPRLINDETLPGAGLGQEMYAGVSRPIAESVSKKLGQRLGAARIAVG